VKTTGQAKTQKSKSKELMSNDEITLQKYNKHSQEDRAYHSGGTALALRSLMLAGNSTQRSRPDSEEMRRKSEAKSEYTTNIVHVLI
jgi:hypothetical protein